VLQFLPGCWYNHHAWVLQILSAIVAVTTFGKMPCAQTNNGDDFDASPTHLFQHKQ
jgi:hypothetical protein